MILLERLQEGYIPGGGDGGGGMKETERPRLAPSIINPVLKNEIPARWAGLPRPSEKELRPSEVCAKGA